MLRFKNKIKSALTISLVKRLVEICQRRWHRTGYDVRHQMRPDGWLRLMTDVQLRMRSDYVWWRLSTDGWQQSTNDIWWRLSTDGWQQSSDYVWRRLSSDGWQQSTDETWWRLSTDRWQQMTDNIWWHLSSDGRQQMTADIRRSLSFDGWPLRSVSHDVSDEYTEKKVIRTGTDQPGALGTNNQWNHFPKNLLLSLKRKSYSTLSASYKCVWNWFSRPDESEAAGMWTWQKQKKEIELIQS